MSNLNTISKFVIIALVFASCNSKSNKTIFNSPDKINKVIVEINEGELFYSVFHHGNKIIKPSQLGIVFKDHPAILNNLKLIKSEIKTVDETWTQPWGEVTEIRNNYNEGVISLVSEINEAKVDLIFRVYDDGVAFRYNVKYLGVAVGEKEKVIITNELTEFNLEEDADSWWIKAYQPNRYEYLYTSTKVSEIDTVHTPLTMRYTDGTHISIHEAALTNYSSMQLASQNSNSLQADLAPWSNGDKVRTNVPFKTPWRTIKIADSAGDLLNSYLTLNCNEPNKLEVVSWIKPSKYIGIWWGMIIGKWTWAEGARHGATTERSKQYIDFAAEHGFDEVLVEGFSAGFNGLFPGDTVTTNFIETTPDFDLEEVQSYARSKGVSLQAYQETSASTTNYLVQIDSAFALMNRLGIDKAKIGHVGHLLDKKEFHYGQFGVEYFRKVLKKAAEYKIGVNFHEPIKGTGERRTYPNMLSREGAKGMEYNAWGGGGNPPDHTTILPFTRLLEAPMDFTPGIFDLHYKKLDVDNENQIPVTLKVIDYGNGYKNVKYKGAESHWQIKLMSCDTTVKNGDTIYTWTLIEYMKPGDWQWGPKAEDVVTDHNDLWLLGLVNQPNMEVSISESGVVSGQTSFVIPNFGFESKDKVVSNSAPEQDMNEFGVTQRVNSTLANQLALYVVIYSPIQMASDFIENYENQPAFQFIKDVPVDWEDTKIINGEIGEFVTIARKDKNSKDWYLGSITNEESRTFTIDLSFLGDVESYKAEYYSDGENADLDSNPSDISIGEKDIENDYIIKLARGGGHAVRFKYMGADE